MPHPFTHPLIRRTIVKMLRSQEKKKEIIEYILENEPDLLANPVRRVRVRDCCNVLRFVDYGKGEAKLYRANFCKYDKFCLACATRRSIKKIQQFVQGIHDNRLETKHRYHITLTIRHNQSQSLEELLDTIMAHKKTVTQGVRNSKRDNQKKKSFFSQFDGMASSIEVTYSQANGWHPHIHLLACSDNEIPTERSNAMTTISNRELQKERYRITGDSYCVAMRKVDVSKDHFDRQGIAEVFKYAVKFSTLETPQLVSLIALQKKKQYRFYATTGILRGRKSDIPKISMQKSIQTEIDYLPAFEMSDFVFDSEKHIYSINNNILI